MYFYLFVYIPNDERSDLLCPYCIIGCTFFLEVMASVDSMVLLELVLIQYDVYSQLKCAYGMVIFMVVTHVFLLIFLIQQDVFAHFKCAYGMYYYSHRTYVCYFLEVLSILDRGVFPELFFLFNRMYFHY
jgi:hypothetical protein